MEIECVCELALHNCLGPWAKLQTHSYRVYTPSGSPQSRWVRAEIQHSFPCQAQRGHSFPILQRVIRPPPSTPVLQQPPLPPRRTALSYLTPGANPALQSPFFASEPVPCRLETLQGQHGSPCPTSGSCGHAPPHAHTQLPESDARKWFLTFLGEEFK